MNIPESALACKRGIDAWQFMVSHWWEVVLKTIQVSYSLKETSLKEAIQLSQKETKCKLFFCPAYMRCPISSEEVAWGSTVKGLSTKVIPNESIKFGDFADCMVISKDGSERKPGDDVLPPSD